MTAAAPSRWKTIVTDSLGFVAVVWAIPAAIVVVGLPIALLFMGLKVHRAHDLADPVRLALAVLCAGLRRIE